MPVSFLPLHFEGSFCLLHGNTTRTGEEQRSVRSAGFLRGDTCPCTEQPVRGGEAVPLRTAAAAWSAPHAPADSLATGTLCCTRGIAATHGGPQGPPVSRVERPGRSFPRKNARF